MLFFFFFKAGYLKPLQTCVPETPIVKTTVLTFKGMDFYLGSTPLMGVEHENVTESNLSHPLDPGIPNSHVPALSPKQVLTVSGFLLIFLPTKNVLGDPAVELS